MPIIYRKTAKGVSEIETRKFRLVPRLRSLLILLDGKRDSADLSRLTAQPAEEGLQALADQGFIEAVGETIDPPPHPEVAPQSPHPAEQVATSAADLNSLRRQAIRALTEQLGPAADNLAIRMERARTLPELQALFIQAANHLSAERGPAAAAAFSERFQIP